MWRSLTHSDPERCHHLDVGGSKGRTAKHAQFDTSTSPHQLCRNAHVLDGTNLLSYVDPSQTSSSRHLHTHCITWLQTQSTQLPFVNKSMRSSENMAGRRQRSTGCTGSIASFENRNGSILWGLVSSTQLARNSQIDVDISRRSVSTVRVALKDFTFSTGVRIPAGTFICVPLYATHHAEGKYPDPFTFDPNRFISSPKGHGTASAAEKDGGPRPRQLVTTSADYLAWGLGRHAWCVRRFFMLCSHGSHTYFIALEGGLRP